MSFLASVFATHIFPKSSKLKKIFVVIPCYHLNRNLGARLTPQSNTDNGPRRRIMSVFGAANERSNVPENYHERKAESILTHFSPKVLMDTQKSGSILFYAHQKTVFFDMLITSPRLATFLQNVFKSRKLFNPRSGATNDFHSVKLSRSNCCGRV